MSLCPFTRQLLCQLWIHVAIVLLAARHILGLVALQRVYVEHGAQTASVRPGNALDTDVKLSTIGGMCVAGVVSRLVDLGWVGTNKAVANLRLVAPLHEIGPDANALLVVVRQARWTLVLGGLSVPA